MSATYNCSFACVSSTFVLLKSLLSDKTGNLQESRLPDRQNKCKWEINKKNTVIVMDVSIQRETQQNHLLPQTEKWQLTADGSL